MNWQFKCKNINEIKEYRLENNKLLCKWKNESKWWKSSFNSIKSFKANHYSLNFEEIIQQTASCNCSISLLVQFDCKCRGK